MRILLIHNVYQLPGGEDQVFAAEGALLEAHGHQVLRHVVHNDAVRGMGPLALAAATIWNRHSYRELRALARQHRPDVAHLHNTLPLISPAAYDALRAEGVPVVQTLHNYRLACPNALLYREGRVCEECLGRLPWPGVRHRCYRGSLPASAAVAAMLTLHRALGTWAHKVDRYLALTEFARDKFVAAGLPADKVSVKPNFCFDPGLPPTAPEDYYLFVGRLDAYKGVDTLLAAWALLGGRARLRIVGDGPLAEVAAAAAAADPAIAYLGRLPREEVAGQMARARALVMASHGYEGFPMVIAEAYAAGLPVITGDVGSAATLVAPHETGLHYRANDPAALAHAVAWLQQHAEAQRALRQGARAAYERRYTPEANYTQLMALYQQVQRPAPGRRLHT